MRYLQRPQPNNQSTIAMKKKSLFTILSIISFLFYSSAQKTSSKGFSVKGHISGIDDGTKIYLYHLSDQIYLDSAVANNGNFVLQGYVNQPAGCWLQCKNEYANLMIENTSYTFTSPIKRMRLNAVIKGGREQALENELAALQYPFNVLTEDTYDSLSQKLYTTKEDKNRLTYLLNFSQDTAQKIYVDFGRNHPDSYLGLNIIYRNRTLIGQDSIKAMLSRLSGPVKSGTDAVALQIFANNELVQLQQPFIDFEAKTLEGKPFKLSDLKGKYVLLNFWGTGCRFCRAEIKAINENYERLKSKVTIVNFSIDKNHQSWQEESKDCNIQWLNVSDLQGNASKTKIKYNVQGIPASFVINEQGIIIGKLDGYEGPGFIKKLEAFIGSAQTQQHTLPPSLPVAVK